MKTNCGSFGYALTLGASRRPSTRSCVSPDRGSTTDSGSKGSSRTSLSRVATRGATTQAGPATTLRSRLRGAFATRREPWRWETSMGCPAAGLGATSSSSCRGAARNRTEIRGARPGSLRNEGGSASRGPGHRIRTAVSDCSHRLDPHPAPMRTLAPEGVRQLAGYGRKKRTTGFPGGRLYSGSNFQRTWKQPSVVCRPWSGRAIVRHCHLCPNSRKVKAGSPT